MTVQKNVVLSQRSFVQRVKAVKGGQVSQPTPNLFTLKKIHILHHRLYHLLWRTLPKEELEIDGDTIAFVVLPSWVLIGAGAKTFFVDAMCITYGPTRTKMIFIATQMFLHDKTFRYVLYHEHIEAMFNLGLLQTDPGFFQRLEHALGSLGEKDGSLLDRRLRESLTLGMERGHAVAIILEAAMAKGEMPEAEWRPYFQNMLKNRLREARTTFES